MIKFDQVTKQFSDDSYALREVSFDITPGEFILLTGPSGSGKTTIMRLLTKEYTPTEGEITFGDTTLSELSKSKIHLHRRKIGVVFQDYKLLTELNVWENIALALNIIGKNEEEIETRVTDLLRLVNLAEKAYLFPSQLSGGEAQRVSIARALATGPSVIFADEPTGNLDPETSLTIARLLKKINELGTTVLFASHDISVLQALPDERHIHLNQGTLEKDSKGSTNHKVSKPQTEAKAKADHTPTEPEPEVEKEKEVKPEPSDEKEDETETTKTEVTVEVESIDDSPKKKKGFSIGWPFGKKKSPSKEGHFSDKNEDLNRLHGGHHFDVTVESLDTDKKKANK